MTTRRRRRPSSSPLPKRPRAQASSVTAPAGPAPLLASRRRAHGRPPDTAAAAADAAAALVSAPARVPRAVVEHEQATTARPPHMDQTPRLGFQVPWTAPAVPAPLLPSRRQLTAGRPTQRQPRLTQRPHSFRRRRASRAPSPSTSRPAARSRAIIQVARLLVACERSPST